MTPPREAWKGRHTGVSTGHRWGGFHPLSSLQAFNLLEKGRQSFLAMTCFLFSSSESQLKFQCYSEQKLKTSRKQYHMDPLRPQKWIKEHLFTINKHLKGILKCHIFALCITVDLLICMFKQCGTLWLQSGQRDRASGHRGWQEAPFAT